MENIELIFPKVTVDQARLSHKRALIKVARHLGIKVDIKYKYTPQELLGLILKSIDVKNITFKAHHKELEQLRARVKSSEPIDPWLPGMNVRSYE